MLRNRILSALVGIPLIILAVWHGGLPLLALSALVILFSLSEMREMFHRLNIRLNLWLMAAGSLILLGSVYLYQAAGLGGAVTLIVFMFLIWTVFLYPGHSLTDMATGLVVTLYVGLFIYVYLLRTLPNGWVWILFMVVGTWSSDTAAYFAGKRLGRKPLAPKLSPGKTVEGAAGGILGSILWSVAFLFIYPFLPKLPLLLLGLLVGIAAQIGDLVESIFKRQAGVKDAGDIIPGHGGMLDRFDSMLFTAPLVYYYVTKICI